MYCCFSCHRSTLAKKGLYSQHRPFNKGECSSCHAPHGGEIAGLLKKNLRKLDVITRYGGDEYVIIMPQTARQSCMFVAERLRREIEKEEFLKSEGLAIKLTASFGVASYPDNARNKEELLKIADKAMYHGKFLTKNIVFEAK